MSQSDSRPAAITVLWATHPQYETPHVVRAWPHSLIQAGYGLDDEIREAKEWMEEWGDEQGWTYWTTIEHVQRPAVPADEEALV